MRVILSISGTQRFGEDAPETTELVTEGELERRDGALILSYEESELTGMEGTVTTFHIAPPVITLQRTGAVESKMVFTEGIEDRSLYDMGFGALMITVCADTIRSDMSETGGTLDVTYSIVIEQAAAGSVHYRITARPKE